MPTDDMTELRRAEDRLLSAMIAGDVDELDRLVDDEAVFTDQGGQRLSKGEDLALHRSRILNVDRIEALTEPTIKPFGSFAVILSKLRIVGWYAGVPFDGCFAYSRIWRRVGADWVVAAAHASTASS